MDITQLLAFTMQNSASDLHLSPGNSPIVRAHGDLKRIKMDSLSSDDIRSMIYSVMTEEQRADFEKDKDLDFVISFGEKARFRVNIFMTRNGPAAVFRTIPSIIPTMEELDLPPILRRFMKIESGIVLVTGQTGSGKSTTLAAMINYVNQTEQKHIITVEDPVEFFHTSEKSLINHREVGTDTASFPSALRGALREDPDIILVGEMRDYETISLALTAAETGHLVLGTLHSNSASKTIDRILDVFPAEDKEMARTMLSGSVQGIVSQQLLKTADGKGRVAAHEILVGTNAVRNLIRENQIAQLYSMIQTGTRFGMVTMDETISSLLEAGIISKDVARQAILASTDSGDGMDEDVAASIGGGQLDQKEVGKSSQMQQNNDESSGGDTEVEEGYSF